MFTFADTIEKNILTDLPASASNHTSDAGSYLVSYETNSIRLSYSLEKNRWVASTRKSENAYHSRWAERKSFGTFFEEECEAVSGIKGSEFEEKYLDKTKSYGFLVPLRGANKVLRRDEMPPLLILAEVKSNESWICLDNTQDTALFTGPWSFPTKIDPLNYEVVLDNDPYAVGITFIGHLDKFAECKAGGEATVVRFLYPQFLQARVLRDNTPSILLRYGKLWKERSPLKTEYENHYSEFIYSFDEVVRILYEIYHSRYINGENNQTTPIRPVSYTHLRAHET
jgi:hypothetical protein